VEGYKVKGEGCHAELVSASPANKEIAGQARNDDSLNSSHFTLNDK